MGATRMPSSRPDVVVDFVLRNRDMASLIFAFQDGFPQDITRLKQAVDLPAFARLYFTKAIHFIKWSLQSIRGQGIWNRIQEFNAVCELWLATLCSLDDISRRIHGIPFMEGVLLVHAATTGNLPLFQRGFQHPDKWLCGIVNWVQCGLSTSTVCRVWLDLAAWSGHVNIIAFIASQQLIDDPFDDKSCLDGAAAHGHVEVVQYLLDRGCQSASALELAAANGHLHVVNILRRRH